MKNWLLILGLLVFPMVDFAQTDYILLSYNIRFNNPSDGMNAWPNRSQIMIDSLKHLDGSIYCFQEVLIGQFNDLKKGLPDYDAYGIGRNNGKTKGEMCPIFYKAKEWEAKASGTFWLSEKPEKPGKGWDAGIPRIASWIQLKNKGNGQILFVFNTHFDHKGVEARKKSGPLLARKAAEIAGAEAYIICGDLNLTEEHSSYLALTQKLMDSRKVAKTVTGPEYSFGGFEVKNPPNPLHRIDFIFVSQSMAVNSYNCPDWKSRADNWLSDHRPVYIQFNPFLKP